MQPLQPLKVLKEKEDSIALTWPFCENMKYFDLITCMDRLKLQIGQAVQAVKSCKFCCEPPVEITQPSV
jgi:hypothetical protein